ncbi:MAG: hypothetical protein O7D94_10135, partial [Planctomycetota bacterium]|nr:hypothetical protein [Planctomycetota bacterium]
SRPMLESKFRRSYESVFRGVRPGRVGLIILIVAVVSLFAAVVNAVLKPAYKYQVARERFGEPKEVNEWCSIAGYIIEPEAGGGWSIELVYESRGPMPKNLQIYFHADRMDENEKLLARYGRNFFPSLITSYWPVGKYVVAETTSNLPHYEYVLKAGFFDLNDGARYGEVVLGRVDLAALSGENR